MNNTKVTDFEEHKSDEEATVFSLLFRPMKKQVVSKFIYWSFWFPTLTDLSHFISKKMCCKIS